MKSTFQAYFPHLLKHEGGYSDHARDPGGATNLGITLKTLSAWRGRPVSKAEVRALSQAEAENIYRAWYWNKIDGDLLPAGPDAALFDVAVNSGVGRAKAWLPLISGKGPVDAVKAVCARRRAFFRSLSTFSTFGKGWMRRVNEVEAWCIAWAVKTAGGDVKGRLQAEAADSKDVAQKATGTAATGAAGGGGVATMQADKIDWVTLLAIGVPVLLAIAVLVWLAVAHSSRAEAMKEMAENV